MLFKIILMNILLSDSEYYMIYIRTNPYNYRYPPEKAIIYSFGSSTVNNDIDFSV
jgi:hypothetical protein